MSEFLKDTSGFRAIRKEHISAAQLNPCYYDHEQNKRCAINIILKSGEKASLVFDDIEDAKKMMESL